MFFGMKTMITNPSPWRFPVFFAHLSHDHFLDLFLHTEQRWPNVSPSASASPTTLRLHDGASSRPQVASSATTILKSSLLRPSAATVAPSSAECVAPTLLYFYVGTAHFTTQVVALRPREYATVSKTKKHVTRAYGGSRCGGCVRSRYVIALNAIFAGCHS
jgi:Ribosomal protein L34e